MARKFAALTNVERPVECPITLYQAPQKDVHQLTRALFASGLTSNVMKVINVVRRGLSAVEIVVEHLALKEKIDVNRIQLRDVQL